MSRTSPLVLQGQGENTLQLILFLALQIGMVRGGGRFFVKIVVWGELYSIHTLFMKIPYSFSHKLERIVVFVLVCPRLEKP